MEISSSCSRLSYLGQSRGLWRFTIILKEAASSNTITILLKDGEPRMVNFFHFCCLIWCSSHVIQKSDSEWLSEHGFPCLGNQSSCGSGVLKSIHPSIHPHLFTLAGLEGARAYVQQSLSKRRGPPWTDCQSITYEHRDIQHEKPCMPTFTINCKVERHISLIIMFSECGRKLEYPEKTYTWTGKSCKHLLKPIGNFGS